MPQTPPFRCEWPLQVDTRNASVLLKTSFFLQNHEIPLFRSPCSIHAVELARNLRENLNATWTTTISSGIERSRNVRNTFRKTIFFKALFSLCTTDKSGFSIEYTRVNCDFRYRSVSQCRDIDTSVALRVIFCFCAVQSVYA